MLDALESPPASAVHIQAAVSCRLQLAEVGYDCPDWQSLLDGLRPRQVDLDEMDPGVPTHGWQFFAAQASERHFRTEVLWPRLASGPFAGLPFWPCHLRLAHASLPNFSACFFSAACGFPCPCLLALAGVAVHSTSLTTTAQRARGQVYWPVVASLSKALLQGCAGRQVPASPPTCSFGTWTCQSHVTMVDDWKSWLTGFHCSMVLSSPLTPHWSLQFVQTVSPRRQCAHVGRRCSRPSPSCQAAHLSRALGQSRLRPVGCSRS